MSRKWSVEYITGLLASDDYMALVDLSQCLCSSPRFQMHAPDYGLPPAAFVFVELLRCFAQAVRSGPSEYFEATNQDRKQAMVHVLQTFAPPQFSHWYAIGMKDDDGNSAAALDEWVSANDSEATTWMRDHVRKHRDLILQLTD